MTSDVTARRRRTLIAAAAITAVSLTVSPVEAAEIPEVVNVEDPANDANAVNDQGADGDVGQQGNHTGPANVDDRGDILAVWFTNTDTLLSVHVQTAEKPPGPASTYGFRVWANGNSAASACTVFEAFVAGPSWVGGDTRARIRDLCMRPGPGGEPFTDGEVTIEDGPDGTSILTMHFEIASAPMIELCDVIRSPDADVRYLYGPSSPFVVFPQIDDTEVGSDYQLVPAAKERSKKRSSKNPACPSMVGT